jgi:hypothetical protein
MKMYRFFAGREATSNSEISFNNRTHLPWTIFTLFNHKRNYESFQSILGDDSFLLLEKKPDWLSQRNLYLKKIYLHPIAP